MADEFAFAEAGGHSAELLELGEAAPDGIAVRDTGLRLRSLVRGTRETETMARLRRTPQNPGDPGLPRLAIASGRYPGIGTGGYPVSEPRQNPA